MDIQLRSACSRSSRRRVPPIGRCTATSPTDRRRLGSLSSAESCKSRQYLLEAHVDFPSKRTGPGVGVSLARPGTVPNGLALPIDAVDASTPEPLEFPRPCPQFPRITIHRGTYVSCMYVLAYHGTTPSQVSCRGGDLATPSSSPSFVTCERHRLGRVMTSPPSRRPARLS